MPLSFCDEERRLDGENMDVNVKKPIETVVGLASTIR